MNRNLVIKGMRPLKEIMDLPGRTYGIEIHCHFPYEEIEVHSSKTIALPEDKRQLLEAVPDYPNPQKWFMPDAYAATVEDCYLIGNSGMIVTPDGWLIKESAGIAGYQLDQRCIDVPTLLNKIKCFSLEGISSINGRCYVAVNPNFGYAHQLIECCLPMLFFNNCQFHKILVTPGNNMNIVKQWVHFAGLPEDYLLAVGQNQVIQAKQLSFYGLSSFALFRPELRKKVYETLIKPKLANKEPDKKIFLLPDKASLSKNKRLCDNLEEVVNFFSGNGYEMMDPAEYNFAQKIDLLAQAKSTVSLAGSSLFNVHFFSSPQTLNALLFPPSFFPLKFFLTALAVEYNFCHLLGVFPNIYKKYFGNYRVSLTTLGSLSLFHDNPKVAFFKCDYPAQFVSENGAHVDSSKLQEFYKLLDVE